MVLFERKLYINFLLCKIKMSIYEEAYIVVIVSLEYSHIFLNSCIANEEINRK